MADNEQELLTMSERVELAGSTNDKMNLVWLVEEKMKAKLKAMGYKSPEEQMESVDKKAVEAYGKLKYDEGLLEAMAEGYVKWDRVIKEIEAMPHATTHCDIIQKLKALKER